MEISITITGTKDLKRKVVAIGSGMRDLSGAFREIGERASEYYAAQGYLSQGGVFNASWKPLSRSYAIWKAKHYPGRPPLVRSGKMISGYRFSAGPTQVIVGNRMPYFKYHQSTKDRKKIPRRVTMGINDPIKRIIQEAIKKDIRKKIRSA